MGFQIKPFLFFALSFFTTISFTQSIDYDWKQVPIGGGGYIIGMKVHPSDANVRYFRTDIGGAYKWNIATQSLDQLIFFGKDKSHYYGVGGIALDPNDVNKVILAVGRYCDPNKTAILVSNDQGLTWSQEIVPGAQGHNIYFATNGGRGCQPSNNDKDRQGSPIALNPNNPNELYIGARGTGLWKLNLATETFTPLANGVIPNNDFPNSIRTIEFHPTQPNLVYVAYAGHGIYRGNTSNNTYVALNTSADLKQVSDISISKGGNYLLAACKFKGIYKATNIAGAASFNKVLSYTGTASSAEAFLTVTCSPHDEEVAVTVNSDWEGLNTFRVSTNHGNLNSWVLKSASTYDNLYPWHDSGFGSHISQIAFDPDNMKGLFFTSWFTSYYTEDFTGSSIAWTNKYSKGHEEAVITDIVGFSINTDDNFVCMTGGDQTGFLFSQLVDFPSDIVSDRLPPAQQNNLIKGASIDYCVSDPDHLVLCLTKDWSDTYSNGNLIENTGDIIYSNDGGASFTRSTGYQDDLGKSVVAMSSGDPKRVVIASEEGLKYSSDYGDTFSSSSSANVDQGSSCTNGNTIASMDWGHAGANAINTSIFSTFKPLASDKVLSCVFYFYDWNDGSFHVSTDFGASFFQVADGFPSFANNIWKHKTRVNPVPGFAKHVWLNFNDGLHFTDDAGESWTTLQNVQNAELVAIGKQMAAGSYPTIFLFGKANNDNSFGYYRSIDQGVSWNLIHDPSEKEIWGGAKVLGADMNVEGRVYISAGGLGALYGDDKTVINPLESICKTNLVPTIDGLIDPLWDLLPVQEIDHLLTGTSTGDQDISADYKMTWDDNALYFLVQVEDDMLINDSGITRPYFDDGIEIYIDGGNDKSNSYDANDHQYIFRWNDNNIYEYPGGNQNPIGVTSGWSGTGSSYTYEMKIEWSAIGVSPASILGFDVHINDDDTGGNQRDAKLTWTPLVADNAWQDPSVFGEILLNSEACNFSDLCELIENGSFGNNTNDWILNTFSTAQGNLSIDQSGYLEIEVLNPGTANWHLGARQVGILLEEGKTYEVSFKAYAAANRPANVIVTRRNGYQYHYKGLNLTTTPQLIQYQFTMNDPTDTNAYVNMNAGGNTESVFFDDISIREINCTGCTNQLAIRNQDIFEGIYNVEHMIESNGKVSNLHDVDFKADEIILEPSFEVITGTAFRAIIAPCNAN